MRHWIRFVGLAAVGFGLLIALFPVFSVARLSGQVLNELPDVAATDFSDDRHTFALLDPDFVLGTRTYEATTPSEIEAELRARGFESTGARGQRWFSKPCCGEYDAVWVQIADTDAGASVLTLTAADSDIQSVWPFFAAVGFILATSGILVAAWPRTSIDQSESSPASEAVLSEV